MLKDCRLHPVINRKFCCMLQFVHHQFIDFLNSLSVSASDILRLQSGGIVQNLLEPGVAVSDDAVVY